MHACSSQGLTQLAAHQLEGGVGQVHLDLARIRAACAEQGLQGDQPLGAQVREHQRADPVQVSAGLELINCSTSPSDDSRSFQSGQRNSSRRTKRLLVGLVWDVDQQGVAAILQRPV